MALRFHMVIDIDDWNTPRWRQAYFEKPLPRKPSRIFVNSMSDWGDWKEEWKWSVLQKINKNPQHIFLTLTKKQTKENNLTNWLQGITRTSGLIKDKADFVSVEPIQGETHIGYNYKWVIIGLQTGIRKKNNEEIKWAEELGVECAQKAIPVFFKDSLSGCYGFRQQLERNNS
jgi:protein gp37